ncbi:MAG: NAD-dependent epimerase/dehydratase family protein [Solirubrobacterales bacterium]
MTRSVVTGGAGFIGSNLVDALVRRGDQVLVIDDLSTGRVSNLTGARAAGVDLRVTDLGGAEARSETVAFAPDVVFHLGAQADVRRAVADPIDDARINVLGTINVLEAARESEARILFAATGGAVYGEGEGKELPFDEHATAVPETPYGVSKLAGEHYVEMYRLLHGVPGLALRFGNVYGPRQDPHGEAGVVAIFCGSLLDGRRPTVFGDGLQTRDYVFVGDAVAALMAADERLAAAGSELTGPLNIGTGVETSVLELVDRLGELSDAPFEAELGAARPGEMRRSAIDSSAAGSLLGWSAGTDLATGLAVTLESVRAERRAP